MLLMCRFLKNKQILFQMFTHTHRDQKENNRRGGRERERGM